MNLSLLVTILGIIATVILGTWSIILFFRTKYPGKITFYIEDIIGLFDSIVKNLPELSILFKDNNVSQNLFLLKGCFVNNGYKDITESMVEERVSLIFPKNYQILTAKVVSTDSMVKASITMDSNHKLIFNIGLFRIKEYFRFEALIEIQSEDKPLDYINKTTLINNIENSIVFTHRIADTKKIEKDRIEKVSESKRKNIFQFSIIFTMSVILLIILLFLINDSSFFIIHYGITDGNKTFDITFYPKSNNSIELKGINDDYKKIVSIEQFKKLINESEIKIIKFEEYKKFFLILFYSFIGILVCSTLLILLLIIEKRNNIKLLKQIGLRK